MFVCRSVCCMPITRDLQNFFPHEKPFFSEYRRLMKCNGNADFLKCLQDLLEPSYEPLIVDKNILDGSAFVDRNPLKL